MPEQDLEDRTDNEVQFLMGLLKKAAAEREQLLLTIAKKDGMIAEQNSVVEERALEADIFAKTLLKERKKFDRRLVKLKDTIAKRDELLVSWAGVGTALSVSHPTVMSDTLQQLVAKTCRQLPDAQSTSTSVYKHYVSRMLEGQEAASGEWNPLTTTPEHVAVSDNKAPSAALLSLHSSTSQHSHLAPPEIGSSASGLRDLETLLGMVPGLSLSGSTALAGDAEASEHEERGITVASERSATAAAPRKFWWDHLVDNTSVAADENEEGPASSEPGETSPAKNKSGRLMLGSGLDDALDLSD